ncbi:MAG: hypothetical protein EOO17_04015 [Chloroflexi bacterium]|nr:MAG: hypothetical protein EOO17_04015 [Chloroflexota bacterium]
MKPLFSARSPLWQIAAVIILYPLLMLIAYARSRMITARATRLVYRFHTFALPLAAVLLIYLPLSIYSALSCLFVLSLGHYATYWYAIWPAFKESEEE